MLTEKMQTLYRAIELMIDSNEFDTNYLEYIFSGLTSKRDIILHILIELCKEYFDSSQECHSLNFYLKGEGETTDDIDDSERMRLRRTFEYINNNRESLYSQFCKKGIIIEGLRHQKKHQIKDKLNGLNLTPFQFWEISNTHEVLLIKAIVNHQINSKNFTSDRFREYALQYDTEIQRIKKIYELKDPLFSTFAYFVLEANYYLDFYYQIADYITKKKIVPPDNLEQRVNTFRKNVTIYADLFYLHPKLKISSITTNNRMIVFRKSILESIINMSNNEFEIEAKKYAECLALASLLRLRLSESGMVNNFVAKHDWDSLVETYDIYQCFVADKEWTKAKIRIVKKLYKRY